ncbi:MAG: glycosyl transferase, partial [Alistipes sp.]|nr:glycosyl transferase [Alistipes sp.]
LYVLRSNAARYIHGHSAGGTNPSLVEAMFFGREIFAFDVVYNRETTKNKALYFSDAESLSALLALPIKENVELQNIAKTLYTWAVIRDKYEDLF